MYDTTRNSRLATRSSPAVIAIDGPAASGKTTVGDAVARRLGWLFFDTGAMYRAVTWAAQDRVIPVENELRVTALAESLSIEVTGATVADGRQYTVLADGQDVTWHIREPAVEAVVSVVAAYPGVRQALTQQMRKIAAEQCVIMAGLDIGTVVLPDADLKIYMTASVEERAQRRFRELAERGEPTTLAAVLESMRRRDDIDSHRKCAPLKAAADAVIVDTDGQKAPEVFAAILALIEERWPEKG